MIKNTFTFLLISCLAVFFFACEKESTNPAPTTNRDTVYVHDTTPCIQLTNAQALVSKDWQIDELFRFQSGSGTHYVRGGVNTTGTTYNNMRFHFNSDGTGTYTDEVATTHTVNWSFTSTDQKNMSLIIGPPFANVFTWNMIEIKNNFLHTTSPYTGGLISARYIQIP